MLLFHEPHRYEQLLYIVFFFLNEHSSGLEICLVHHENV